MITVQISTGSAVSEREHEYSKVRRILADLEKNGLTVYKIALMLGQQYNTVKHWKSTGRVESHDAKLLRLLHETYCPPAAGVCQIEPQYCKVLTIST
mgnify:CR=1 FL=1